MAACSGLAGRLPVVTTAIPAAAISGRTTGVALVAAGAVSVQFGGAVAITLFDRVGAGGAVMLRLVVAAVMLVLGTVLARVAQRWRGHRAVAARHSRADLAVAAGFGVALAAMNLSFYEAIARIPLGPAVSIELLGPLTLAAVSSRRRTDYAWVAFALAGVATLGLGENRDEPIIWPGPSWWRRSVSPPPAASYSRRTSCGAVPRSRGCRRRCPTRWSCWPCGGSPRLRSAS